jgi:hypothetical protein
MKDFSTYLYNGSKSIGDVGKILGNTNTEGFIMLMGLKLGEGLLDDSSANVFINRLFGPAGFELRLLSTPKRSSIHDLPHNLSEGHCTKIHHSEDTAELVLQSRS